MVFCIKYIEINGYKLGSFKDIFELQRIFVDKVMILGGKILVLLKKIKDFIFFLVFMFFYDCFFYVWLLYVIQVNVKCKI